MSAGVHLLVDLENVQPSPQEVEAWLGETGKAWVFYGPHQHKKKAGFEAGSPRSTLVPISRTGANSLDFHLIFYLGYLAARYPKYRFVVLAKDTGYDPPIAHARTLAFSVKRLQSLSPAVQPSGAPKKSAASQTEKKGPAAPPKKKAVASSKVSGAQKTKGGAMPKVQVAQQVAAKKARAPKLPIAVYRDLLTDLRGPHRPGSLAALQRHIQTKFGPTAMPEKVQMLVERLLTTDVIHVAGSKLVYGPPHVWKPSGSGCQ
ncbi:MULTISPECIES: PIN domain-containing protein [unclassified Variovorax]|uniref:PIN domain-containing protein n=1 Tax=unclassified Variovorax TaxID=663243 RepID=UPI003F44E264